MVDHNIMEGQQVYIPVAPGTEDLHVMRGEVVSAQSGEFPLVKVGDEISPMRVSHDHVFTIKEVESIIGTQIEEGITPADEPKIARALFQYARHNRGIYRKS